MEENNNWSEINKDISEVKNKIKDGLHQDNLTDDLINADTFGSGNMQDIQPNDACRGGSSNPMGLVSGSNII